jgi:ABC-type phosphate transport system auxiliary subunit
MAVKPRPSDLPGRAMTWLTGGTLALNLLLVAGLLALLVWHGAGAFWPRADRRLDARRCDEGLG